MMTRDGRYRVGGLRPGRIYHLRATATGFHPLDTTLEFSAGERRVYDLKMAREVFCPVP